MRKADLHLHTHASSDASFDPEEVFSIFPRDCVEINADQKRMVKQCLRPFYEAESEGVVYRSAIRKFDG